MPTRSTPAGSRAIKLRSLLPTLVIYAAVGALSLWLFGCAAPSSREDQRDQVHLLRLDIEILGDELVAMRPELAPKLDAAKDAADVAASAWDAYLSGGSREVLVEALDRAIVAGDALAAELAGDGSDAAAVVRAALRVLARHALLALEAEVPPHQGAESDADETSEGMGQPSEDA